MVVHGPDGQEELSGWDAYGRRRGAPQAGEGRGTPVIDLVGPGNPERTRGHGAGGCVPRACPTRLGPEDLLSLVGDGGSRLPPPEGWTREEVAKADAKVRAARRRHRWPEWLIRLDRECRSDGQLPYWARWALTMPVTRAQIGRAHV